MSISKGLLAIFFVFFLIFAQTQVLAAEVNLPDVVVGPDKYIFFSIKRLFEKVIVVTKIDKQSKAGYYKDLTLKRTAELKFVVGNKLLGEVERASQRFAYQIGILADYISTDKDLAKRNTDTRELFVSYKSFLEKLRDKYPANSSYWLLIQQDIDSIDLNLQKLK